MVKPHGITKEIMEGRTTNTISIKLQIYLQDS